MEHPEQFGSGQGVRPKVFFWPDFSRTNPYAAMLYASARGAFDISPETLGDANAALPMPGMPGPAVIFHLHWLNAFMVRAKTEEQARQDFTDFLSQLDSFLSKGGRVVWTIHNIVSHDTKFRDLEIEMSSLIAARADVLHFHARSSVLEVRAVFSAERIAISAHGNYVSAYPDDGLSKTAARDALGLDKGEDLVLSLGLVRPYKGHDLMIAAFRALLPDRPRLRLFIAGRVFSGSLTDPVLPLTADEAARITITDGFIEPERLQFFLRAADVGLFPYRIRIASSCTDIRPSCHHPRRRHDARGP